MPAMAPDERCVVRVREFASMVPALEAPVLVEDDECEED